MEPRRGPDHDFLPHLIYLLRKVAGLAQKAGKDIRQDTTGCECAVELAEAVGQLDPRQTGPFFFSISLSSAQWGGGEVENTVGLAPEAHVMIAELAQPFSNHAAASEGSRESPFGVVTRMIPLERKAAFAIYIYTSQWTVMMLKSNL